MKILTIESPTHGTHRVLLDDDDYDRVMVMGKWNLLKVRSTFYVLAQSGSWNYLHRFIMKEELEKSPKGMVVDHINGNGLDNRKENLRVCTVAQNNQNGPPQGKIKFRGVNQHGSNYRAQIWTPKAINIGTFPTIEEAALAYDKKAKEHFGEFATLNFPDGPPPDVVQKIVEGQEEYQKIKKSRQAERQSSQDGVMWSKRYQRWQPTIYINGKRKHLGTFKTEQEAIDARLAAEREQL